MNNLLIAVYLIALLLFAFLRPQWRQIGPSLLDSFVIGLALFATGSIMIWIEGVKDSEAVMRIGLASASSGTLASSLWAFLFRRRISRLQFFNDAKNFRCDRYVDFAISAGLVASTFVCLIFLGAVLIHNHTRALLIDSFLHGAGALNELRVIVSSGVEGYFAPGYVKQFRDIAVPILCSATFLAGHTYRRRSLMFFALFIAILAIFVSGQRLVVVQAILCMGSAILIRRSISSDRKKALVEFAAIAVVLVGAIGVMTVMLGRVPMSEQDRRELRQKLIQNETNTLERITGYAKDYADTVEALRSSREQDGLKDIERLRDDTWVEVRKQQSVVQKLRESETTGDSRAAALWSRFSAPIALVISLGDRAFAAVPRENAISYPLWARAAPAMGSGWATELAGIRPGTQTQLSNDLAIANRNTLDVTEENAQRGNSPLGLPVDVYYNWGWWGVVLVPALYALVLLLFDLLLVEQCSPLSAAAKIFVFFAVPLMYSPFIFVLLGGVVAIGIAVYVFLTRRVDAMFAN